MRYSITVANRDEGDQIRDGLEDPAVRAFVKVYGVLKSLPTDRSRIRVLTYLADRVDEQIELEQQATSMEVN